MDLRSFVFYTGLYNAGLATALLFPAFSFGLLGLELHYPGNIMIAGFLYFTVALLIYCSRDVKKYATIIYYEGLLRLGEAAIMFHAAFNDGGFMFFFAAIGDLLIGLTYMIQLNRQTGNSHLDLLLARPASA